MCQSLWVGQLWLSAVHKKELTTRVFLLSDLKFINRYTLYYGSYRHYSDPERKRECGNFNPEPIYGFFSPGGYEDEHITHYNRAGLVHLLNSMGFSVEKVFYILKAELIIVARKDN